MLPLIRPLASRPIKLRTLATAHPPLRTVRQSPMPRMVQRRRLSGEAWPLAPAQRSPGSAMRGTDGDALHEALRDTLHEARVAWARARRTRFHIDPVLLQRPPQASDSSLARPWRTVMVPRSALRWLAELDYTHASSHACLWGIGSIRAASNSNPVDVDGSALSAEMLSRRPGQGRFAPVVCGPYGERYSKYLFVIDHHGMHIVREMTPCDLSSRGIALHSLMREQAVVGGELFFDSLDAGKVCINFGSARFPVNSNYQAEKCAEFMLSLGYETVVAMIPEREFRLGEYGLGDRYGKGVQNVVFRAGDDDGGGE